jgi:hypothetical protein
MNRLFTFGCSFTKYNWPTWADILSREFWCAFNWGVPGIGNRGIMERLVEAHLLHEFQKDDVIIIQWTGWNRHDYARSDYPTPISKWKTSGSIFSPQNQGIFDLDWCEKFYNEKDYFIHTLNSIKLSQHFLESLNCKWFMMLGIDIIRSLDTETLDPNKTDLPPNKNVWDMSPDLLPYKKSIWGDYPEKWFPSLEEEKRNTPDLDWYFKLGEDDKKVFHYTQVNGDSWLEPHLTMRQNYNYLVKNNIFDRLDIKPINQSETFIEMDYLDKCVTEKLYLDEFIYDRIMSMPWAKSIIHLGR